MKVTMKKVAALVVAATCALTTFGCGAKKEEDGTLKFKDVEKAKNVILMIGDGMGPSQIQAGELYKGSKLTMQKFPYRVEVETRSHNSGITDSSAAATAMATGVRIYNSEVGIDLQGNPLETIVDIAASKGKRTGIITTEWLAGATPMGFSSHNVSRSNSAELVQEAAKSSNVNMFLSYKDNISGYLLDGNYKEIEDPTMLSEATEDKVFGSYMIKALAPSMEVSENIVALDGLMLEALEYLSKDEDGFFLMTEGAHIDHGGHENNFQYMLDELIAFDAAVEVVVEWASKRDDTVVIVTADHETGGLFLDEKVTSKNLMESYTWTTSGHTNTDVYCYIAGVNVDFSKYSFESKDRIKNTDIFQIMKSLITA